MGIVDVDTLPIPDIKVVRFARFHDDRGYFCEPFGEGRGRLTTPIRRSCAECRSRR